jgi:hypothetical protein
MTVYSLNQEVIVQTDSGPQPGEIRGRTRGWVERYDVLLTGTRDFPKTLFNVEAKKVQAA